MPNSVMILINLFLSFYVAVMASVRELNCHTICTLENSSLVYRRLQKGSHVQPTQPKITRDKYNCNKEHHITVSCRILNHNICTPEDDQLGWNMQWNSV
jgi:hypothetical protein